MKGCTFLKSVRFSGLCYLFTSILSGSVSAQNAPPSYSFFLPAWRIASLQDVRFVRAALVFESRGNRLEIHSLQPSPPFQSAKVNGEHPPFPVVGKGGTLRTILGGTIRAFVQTDGDSLIEKGRLKSSESTLSAEFMNAMEGRRGIRFPLFAEESASANTVFFDARPYGYLTFWLNRQDKREKLSIILYDHAGLQKGKGAMPGEVGAFARAHDPECSWEFVAVPLNTLGSIRMSELAMVELSQRGSGAMGFSAASMEFSPDDRIPAACPATHERMRRRGSEGRAAWVWNSQEILTDINAQDTFLAFVHGNGVSHIFLSLPYDQDRDAGRGGIVIDQELFQPLLQRLNDQNVIVDALFGDPDLCDSSKHLSVVGTINNVAQYNRNAPASARFHGIHLDVEPYLLPGFSGRRHQEILQSYYELIALAQTESHSRGLNLAIDIPFWLDEPNEDTGVLPSVQIAGRRRPLLEALAELADVMVIMDYRTMAYGSNGIILHAIRELEAANVRGKKVFVGLETRPYPDQKIMTFIGPPTEGFRPAGSSLAYLFINEHEDSAMAYLVSRDQVDMFAEHVVAGGRDKHKWYHWMLGRDVDVPGSTITFQRQPYSEFRRVTELVAEELRGYTSFAGFAIHDYEGWRRLMEKDSQDDE